MKRILILSVLVLGALSLSAQPIAVGSVAPGFSLENIDGTTVSLSDYANEKGVMVIFSCNPCPYVQAYEDRMIALHNEFAPQGIPVVLINSNDPVQQPADSFDEMKRELLTRVILSLIWWMKDRQYIRPMVLPVLRRSSC